LPINDWPPDIAGCVASIEVVMKKAASRDGAVDRVLKLKLWNKNDAIKLDYDSYGLTAMMYYERSITSEVTIIPFAASPAIQRLYQLAQTLHITKQGV